LCRRHLHAWAAYASYQVAARREDKGGLALGAAAFAARGARLALRRWAVRGRLCGGSSAAPGLARRSCADAERARRLGARALGTWRARAVARRASAGAAARADAVRARRLSKRVLGTWRARALARVREGEVIAMAMAAAAFLARTRRLERWAAVARSQRAARRQATRADTFARHQCEARARRLAPFTLRAWETDARARWAGHEMTVVARRRFCRNLALHVLRSWAGLCVDVPGAPRRGYHFVTSSRKNNCAAPQEKAARGHPLRLGTHP
jgi:hypothetical protein